MHACPFNMFHNTGNQDIGAVTHRIHLNLLTLQVLIHQNRMILGYPVDNCHKFLNLFVGNGNLHSLSPQHIRRPHQHRIAQTVCNLFSLFRRINRPALRTGNLRFFQNPVKKLPVLCRVHILRLGAENGHTHFHQALGQFYGSLSAELNHRPIGLLNVDNGFHILRRQRLKIKLIRNIKISTYRLRIVIDNDCLITGS